MYRITFLLLLGWLALSCSNENREQTFSEKADEYLSTALGTSGPGGAVLVMKNDQVLFAKGYGLADLQSQEAITTKTLFNLGSITKTFVANGILMLQEEGKLSVEDPLYQYFPEFVDTSIAQKVRIKHLLTHSSGLPDNRQVSKDPDFYLTAKDAENWAPETRVESLEFEPGNGYHYSNPAFNGLALIIEKVSGQKWQDFIREKIFLPAGMRTSTITDGPHPESGVSHCYVEENGAWQEQDYGEEPTFPAAGNGGAWSSVEELALYEKALRAAVFLPAEVIAGSRTPKNEFPVTQLSSLEDQTWHLAYSWFISETAGGEKLVGHTGTQGGFYANYISVPEKEVLFILLANFPCDRQKISQQMMDWIMAENYFE